MTTEVEFVQRFWSRVSGGDVGTCWTWTRGKTVGGYGVFCYRGGSVPAHRFAYQQLVADIPVGLHLDHLCRNRACVNPWHLDPVTPKVNVRRGEVGLHMKLKAATALTCGKGHLWAENEYTFPGSNRRQCRACSRIRDRRRKRTREAAARAAEWAATREGLTCQADGCDEPYSSKGWCKMHAERVRRNGHPYLQHERGWQIHVGCPGAGDAA